jgi:hypothetical protein
MKRNSMPAMIASSVTALAGLGIGCADAADYHLDPMFMVGGTYNSNYGLGTTTYNDVEDVSVEGAILDAQLHASMITPDSHLEITPAVHAVYFPGEAQFDANNAFIDSQFEQLWPRGNFTLNEHFWSQDVLTSYLPTTAISTPLGQNSPGADLASVTERVRQDLLELAPSANFDLTQREHLEIRADFLNVDYSRAILGETQNFRDFSGDLGLGFDVTSQSTVTVRGIASDLRPTIGTSATTYGGEGEWRTHLSEVMQSYARLGVEHTSFNGELYGQSSATSVSGGATSVSGGLGISRKFVAYDLFADFARSVTPDSNGAVVVRNDLRTRLEHKFSGRTAAYVGLRYVSQTALGDSAGFVRQRYGQAALGFEWRIYRQFSIISQYIYTNYKQYIGDAEAAGSNAVTISFKYEPHRPAEEFGVNIYPH